MFLNSSHVRSGLFLVLAFACSTGFGRVQGNIISINAVSTSAVAPGDTVLFDVNLSNINLPDSSDAILSVFLDLSASHAALTSNGADFSAFSFTPSPGLAGLLSLQLDWDVSDDGRVSVDANLHPLGPDTGVNNAAGTLLGLGSLSVVAPAAPGTYNVDLFVDNIFPLAATMLLIDDGSFLGLTAPGDLTLSTFGSNFTVAAASVPEPSAWSLYGLGTMVLLYRRRRKQRSSMDGDERSSRLLFAWQAIQNGQGGHQDGEAAEQ